MKEYINEVKSELCGRIIPFWKGLRDDRLGGYIGQVDFDLTRRPEAERGCILNSRILWFFSEAYMLLGDDSLLDEANHAYEMLIKMTDPKNGGVYWSLNADGTVFDGTKHTYNQAFAIYALSAYYRASKRRGALDRAYELFDTVETKCFDGRGYLEAFTADWKPESNEKLSENGVEAGRTMNTLLHVMEGYTGLYESDRSEKVREKLYFIADVFENKIYNREKHRQEVFFDLDYNTLIDLHSFGHDIETSWLMDHTLDVLGDEKLTQRIRPLLLEMAEKTLEVAFTDHGFCNESENGVINTTRIWWVQAEALLGFMNAYKHTHEEKFREAYLSQWRFIRDVLTDKREGSEWFWCTDENGVPAEKPIVEPWKCPYHNGRMCMEIIRRVKNDL